MEDLLGDLAAITFVFTAVYFFGLLWWKIFARAGHRGVLGLFMFVPFLNLVMLCMLAFREWPIQRDLAHARKILPPERRTIFDSH